MALNCERARRSIDHYPRYRPNYSPLLSIPSWYNDESPFPSDTLRYLRLVFDRWANESGRDRWKWDFGSESFFFFFFRNRERVCVSRRGSRVGRKEVVLREKIVVVYNMEKRKMKKKRWERIALAHFHNARALSCTPAWPAQLSYKYYPALKRDYVKIRRLEREREELQSSAILSCGGYVSLSLYCNAAKRALLFPEGPLGPPSSFLSPPFCQFRSTFRSFSFFLLIIFPLYNSTFSSKMKLKFKNFARIPWNKKS